jgi:hypothetical protein
LCEAPSLDRLGSSRGAEAPLLHRIRYALQIAGTATARRRPHRLAQPTGFIGGDYRSPPSARRVLARAAGLLLQHADSSFGGRLGRGVPFPAQHDAQRFQGAGIALSVKSDRCRFPHVAICVVQQFEEGIHDAGISGRTDLGGDNGAHPPVRVPEPSEGEIDRPVYSKPDQRGDRLGACCWVRVGVGHRLKRLDQSVAFVGIEAVMPARPDPGARVGAAVPAGVTKVRDRAVDGWSTADSAARLKRYPSQQTISRWQSKAGTRIDCPNRVPGARRAGRTEHRHADRQFGAVVDTAVTVLDHVDRRCA